MQRHNGMDADHSHLLFLKQHRSNPQKSNGYNLNKEKFTGDLPALLHFRAVAADGFCCIIPIWGKQGQRIVCSVSVCFFGGRIEQNMGCLSAGVNPDTVRITGKGIIQFFQRGHGPNEGGNLCLHPSRIIQIHIVELGVHEFHIAEIDEQRV